MIRDASISSCGRFRTSLTRSVDFECKLKCCKDSTPMPRPGYALFIGNNPSVGDGKKDDPSIRRMWDFTRKWGYNLMMIGNTNCTVSTDPKGATIPNGSISEINDSWLIHMHRKSAVTVCAWGNEAHVALALRTVHLLTPFGPLHMLRLTQAGNPWHPFYLPSKLMPRLWRSQT